MLDPSFDDIYNWISPIVNSKFNEKVDSGGYKSRSQSPVSEVDSIDTRSPATPLCECEKDPEETGYCKDSNDKREVKVSSSSVYVKKEDKESKVDDSGNSRNSSLKFIHEDSKDIYSIGNSYSDSYIGGNTEGVLPLTFQDPTPQPPQPSQHVHQYSQNNHHLPSYSYTNTSTSTPTPSAPSPSCVECEVAMKDHLLQIYDPFIDYCARCQEAEKDHQLKNIDCSAPSIHSDCLECYQKCEQPPPLTMILPKKPILENQIQPKFSDSRNEALKRKAEYDKLLPLNQKRKPDMFDYHPNRSLYCHWNGHDDEVEFNSELALQAHLRNHIYPQTESDQLECQWDSCDVSLKFVDELLEHIRTDHYNNYGQPHENCSEKLESQDEQGIGRGIVSNSHSHSLPSSSIPSYQMTSPNTNTLSRSSTSSQSPITTTNTTTTSTNTTTIPNQSFTCQWGNCNFVTSSSKLLGLHVLNDHINSSNSIQKSTTHSQQTDINNFINNGTFQCQYQSCDFESLNFDDFTTHIKSDHLTALDKFLNDGTLPTIEMADEEYNANRDHNHNSHTPPHPHPPHSHTHTHSHSHPHPHLPQSSSPISLSCKWILSNNQLCNCTFNNTQELSDHIIKTHVGLRKTEYVCSWEGCDRHHRPFQQRQKMVRHLQVHTNHRPFKCNICGSTFGEESVLKQHLRVHSGERPFECKICKKKFAASAALSVHLRIHTGEKPLKCKYPGCEKRFSESSNLNKHLKTHFTGYPCICPICKESFTDPDQLLKHFKGH